MMQALKNKKNAFLSATIGSICVLGSSAFSESQAQSDMRYQRTMQYFQQQTGHYMQPAEFATTQRHKYSPYGAAIPYYPVTPYAPIASHPAHPLRMAEARPNLIRTAHGAQSIDKRIHLGAKKKYDADPAYLNVAIGRTDVTKGDETVDFRLEYRHNDSFYIFKPFFGIDISGDGAFYGFFGILTDLYFGKKKNFIVTPNFAVGVYDKGKGKDLGYPLEFRSGIEFAYRFEDRSRLGFSIHHISNANIGKKNPGTESVVINYAIPFDQVLDWMP